MSTVPSLPVDYVVSSRRHLKDGHILLAAGRSANAGQLFGFAIECGLKALLLACGIPADHEGGIPIGNKFRQHMPQVNDRFITMGHLISDGARSAHYRAMLPNIGALADWKLDHRYYRESALPLASVPNWDLAALEINEMLDQAIADGVMT